MTNYGVLQPYGTGDAGTWSLIKQDTSGDWRIVARGKAAELNALASVLNGTGTKALHYKPQLVDKDADLPAITAAEVSQWDDERYAEARGRLWTNVHPNGRPTYTDGDNGRPYTTPAAQIMTGTRNRPSASTQLWQATENVVKCWTNPAGNRDMVRAAWPALAALLDDLADTTGKDTPK